MASPFEQPDVTSDDSSTDAEMDERSSVTSSEEANDDPGSPLIGTPPAGKPKTQLLSTPFAPVYRSTFLLEKANQHLLNRLKHLNCSYLSTPGLAPSLTQLKAHAQSLAIIIKALSISTLPSVIDAHNVGLGPAALDGESWDWLSDMSTPYDGPRNPALTYHHSLPLTALLNTLEERPSKYHEHGVEVHDRCPLSRADPVNLQPNGSSLPYATHQALIAHANLVLELIDHEYSAKGGLLAILPPESEKADREKAESTLLGQYILYTQRLVSRLHELEREYANALDILAGESRVPHQALSRLGPEGRQGRELVYPQDRFVLVNAGQDVWDFLDREFSEKEGVDEKVRANYLRNGVMGEKLWENRGGKEFARGITAIDITTRYYRLRRDPLKTIFIIPAHQRHPGVSATVEIERQPTVVSVVKPVWPERQSLWEQRNRDNLKLLKNTQHENEELKTEQEWTREEKKLLIFENEVLDGKVRALERKVAGLEAIFTTDGATKLQAELHTDHHTIGHAKEAAEKALSSARKHETAMRVARRKVEGELRDLANERAEWDKRKNDAEQNMAQKYDKRTTELDELDREQAVGVIELERKLKEVLGGQVKEVQIIVEWLTQRKVAFERDFVSKETVSRGLNVGAALVEGASKQVGFDKSVREGGKVTAFRSPGMALGRRVGSETAIGGVESNLFKGRDGFGQRIGTQGHPLTIEDEEGDEDNMLED